MKKALNNLTGLAGITVPARGSPHNIMNNNYKIRLLQKRDISGLLKIMEEFSDAYSSIYLNSLKRGSIRWLFNYFLNCKDRKEVTCYVLLHNRKVIGHCGYLRDVRAFEGGVYELRALVIAKEYQGEKLSELLRNHIEEKIKKLSGRIIWLQTSSTNKVEKNKYFKKLGYKLIVAYEDYWGDKRNRLVYLKKINRK